MEYAIKTLNTEKKILENFRDTYKLALIKPSLNSRAKIDSKIKDLENAIKILTEAETIKANLNIADVRLSFDEIFRLNCWITKNNWFEACDGEYDNSENPNSCIRLTYEELYKLYINEA